MDYLGNINRQIGDNARWLRGYQAARQSGQDTSQYFGGQGTSRQPQNPMLAMMSMLMGQQAGLEPMLMMMYWQMMNGGMTGNGMPSAQQGGGGFPPYYLNIPDNMLQQFFAGQQTQANPASNLLAEQFKNTSVQTTPDGQAQRFTDAEVTAVQDAMEQGSFSVNQLGEALMKYIHRVPAQYVDDFTDLLGRLVKRNLINPAPFVSEQYLAQLTDERQESLSAALARDGLQFEDGAPNTYFWGHLLQQVNGSPESSVRPFVRDMLTRAYETRKATLDSAAGRQLTGFFALADIAIANDESLEFPGLL